MFPIFYLGKSAREIYYDNGPHFMVENCICLGVLLQDDEKKAGAVMRSSGCLEKVATEKLFQQLMSSPQDQEHPWVRVIWAIARDVLPVKNPSRDPVRSLGGILCAVGWAGVCSLFFIGWATTEDTSEKNVWPTILPTWSLRWQVRNRSTRPCSSPDSRCMESNYFSWLGCRSSSGRIMHRPGRQAKLLPRSRKTWVFLASRIAQTRTALLS